MSKRASTSAKIRQLLQPSTGRKEGTWTKELQAKVQGSLDVLRRMLLEYGPGLGLSFNGGKDCTLLLYLLCVVLEESPLREEPFPTVYVTHHAPFPEVDAFVNDTVRDYGLDMHRVHEPMKAGLITYLEEVPRVKAILVGTRHGDPYSKDLLPVQPTDNGWPVFIRVHPILEWNHADVWAFLRSTGLPYCSLYDEGFTSLGGTDDTCRNPSLARTLHDGVVSYAPAWALGEDGDERDSRMKKR